MAIQEHIEKIIIEKIIYEKTNKTINKKSKFFQLLINLNTIKELNFNQKKQYIKNLINKAYNQIKLQNPLQSAQKVIEKSKTNYLKEQIKTSEIILNKFGVSLSVSKGKFVLKQYGKTIKKFPINWINRIVVLTKGTSLSSTLIYIAAKNKIDIDFIYKQTPYAQITYFNNISNELYLKQLQAKNSNLGLEIAKAIVSAKAKNQINLIKYYARYRKKTDISEYNKLINYIKNMQNIASQIKKAKNQQTLMGYEGSISNNYWRAFAILIDNPNFQRHTQNAPDSINQALNYGYAFIYHRAQSALLKAKLNIYISFLHQLQPNKPTLVFDLVEIFRQPVVDREIISILNLGAQISSNKDKLTNQSVKIITQNIQERLATPTKYKSQKHKLADIINNQALELAHAIKSTKNKFKPFIAKY